MKLVDHITSQRIIKATEFSDINAVAKSVRELDGLAGATQLDKFLRLFIDSFRSYDWSETLTFEKVAGIAIYFSKQERANIADMMCEYLHEVDLGELANHQSLMNTAFSFEEAEFIDAVECISSDNFHLLDWSNPVVPTAMFWVCRVSTTEHQKRISSYFLDNIDQLDWGQARTHNLIGRNTASTISKLPLLREQVADKSLATIDEIDWDNLEEVVLMATLAIDPPTPWLIKAVGDRIVFFEIDLPVPEVEKLLEFWVAQQRPYTEATARAERRAIWKNEPPNNPDVFQATRARLLTYMVTNDLGPDGARQLFGMLNTWRTNALNYRVNNPTIRSQL